jgi:hypothetical protein
MYIISILGPLFVKLTEEERLYGVFHQDSVVAHTAYASSEALWEVFGDV